MTKFYRWIVSFDPSGNFREGKGKTGWVVLDARKNTYRHGVIAAKDYETAVEYWGAHTQFIRELLNKVPREDVILVVEDFLLYADSASAQTNSRMETPKLIGILEFACEEIGIPMTTQTAVQVKKRWADHILVHKNYLLPNAQKGYKNPHNGRAIIGHSRDALRHAVHFKTFYNGTEEEHD